MFRGLRLKLTLTNVLVMAIILLLIIGSIYLFMEKGLFSKTEQVMNLIADSTIIETLETVPVQNGQSFFLVRTDSEGKAASISPGVLMPPRQLNAMINQALQSTDPTGKFRGGPETYAFLRRPLGDGGGYLLVFEDTETEEEMLDRLMGVLIFVGLTAMTVSFGGSYYMAERALVPIKKSWRRQIDFSADASHELRTPLAVIRTNLDVLMSDPEYERGNQSRWLENIAIETDHMAKLIEDLLFLARADSDQMVFSRLSFDLSQALSEAVTPFEPVAEKKGIGLARSYEPDTRFYGDRDRIKQLVVILLDNAIKHTPPGGGIRLESRKKDSGIEISVTDTGEGIDREHLDKIFERFYRADAARTREEGGTGLGLSIAEWIVKGHQGRIRVTSQPGQGSTFVVYLPNPRKVR
ncbi:MAG: sensor histidine kinase [Firmicutes bacterium]|nr:sensor histidine kinase [Bacillota bacterium]